MTQRTKGSPHLVLIASRVGLAPAVVRRRRHLTWAARRSRALRVVRGAANVSTRQGRRNVPCPKAAREWTTAQAERRNRRFRARRGLPGSLTYKGNRGLKGKRSRTSGGCSARNVFATGSTSARFRLTTFGDSKGRSSPRNPRLASPRTSMQYKRPPGKGSQLVPSATRRGHALRGRIVGIQSPRLNNSDRAVIEST
jgi:hypothetical protein